MAIRFNTGKTENFSANELELIDFGIELMRHHKYKQDPKRYDKYAEFSKGSSYDEKLEDFTQALFEECYSRSGIDPAKVSVEKAFNYSHFETAHFAVIEEVIQRTIAKSNVEEFMGAVADVQMVGKGNSANIRIKPKNVYRLDGVARGKNVAGIQRRFSQSVILNPTTRQVTVGFPLDHIIAGRFDYGRELALATEGIQTSLLNEIQALIFNASNPIGNKLTENSFTESSFRLLAQDVETRNGGGKTVILGTRIALGNVLPTDVNLRMDLGEDYMADGYLTNMFGYRAMAFPQAVDHNYARIIPNNRILILTMGADTPIKVAMEDEVRLKKTEGEDSADNIVTYTLEIAWDIELASDAHFGVISI